MANEVYTTSETNLIKASKRLHWNMIPKMMHLR